MRGQSYSFKQRIGSKYQLRILEKSNSLILSEITCTLSFSNAYLKKFEEIQKTESAKSLGLHSYNSFIISLKTIILSSNLFKI